MRVLALAARPAGDGRHGEGSTSRLRVLRAVRYILGPDGVHAPVGGRVLEECLLVVGVAVAGRGVRRKLGRGRRRGAPRRGRSRQPALPLMPVLPGLPVLPGRRRRGRPPALLDVDAAGAVCVRVHRPRAADGAGVRAATAWGQRRHRLQGRADPDGCRAVVAAKFAAQRRYGHALPALLARV